jgi:HAD superfamily hydrolase (TIGR01509 family)
MQALLFDCDGVLADTERDGHRVAFNQAFRMLAVDVEWSVDRYETLLKIAGGKERMRRHFDEAGWPATIRDRDQWIDDLHAAKTTIFMDILREGRLPIRTGVARLADEAIAAGVKIAVCSTSNERAVQAVVDQLGARRAAHITVFAGDIVSAKKPDPAIYNLACDRLQLEPSQCVVIEDSNNGLRAALQAGMHCIVTVSSYTALEDFSGADKVTQELGDGPATTVSLADCQALCPDR